MSNIFAKKHVFVDFISVRTNISVAYSGMLNGIATKSKFLQSTTPSRQRHLAGHIFCIAQLSVDGS